MYGSLKLKGTAGRCDLWPMEELRNGQTSSMQEGHIDFTEQRTK